MTRPWSQVKALRRNDENGYIHEGNVTVVGEDGEERIDVLSPADDCSWTEERVLALQAEVDRLTALMHDEWDAGVRVGTHRERARIWGAVEGLPTVYRWGTIAPTADDVYVVLGPVLRIIDGGEA